MPALPKSPLAESALAAALNGLLDAQPGALSRLRRHAGKTLRLVLPLSPLDLTLDEASRFHPPGETSEAGLPAEPALTLTPSPSALPRSKHPKNTGTHRCTALDATHTSS